MNTPDRASESEAAYEASIPQLPSPVILEHDGHPFAVVLSYEEFKELQALKADDEQRVSFGWTGLERLSQEVHRRPSELGPDEIEAEITAARLEVRQWRHANRSPAIRPA